MFRYAVTTGRAERDISPELRDALKSTETKHHAAIVEPKEIGALLRAIDGYGGHPTSRAALQLAPLVFVRPGELRRAEWADFDLDRARWRYTSTKTGNELVTPLPRQAVAVLREMQSLTGRGKYVFPSMRGRARPHHGLTCAGAHQGGKPRKSVQIGALRIPRTNWGIWDPVCCLRDRPAATIVWPRIGTDR